MSSVDLANRISLYKLDVFRLVVELGSVSRAADRLFVTQPVVTGHVRSLEQRLGVELFVRKGHALELTEAGHAAYRWACDIRAGSDRLRRELAGLAGGYSGAVSIAAGMSSGSYLLPPILARFALAHPDVELSLEVMRPDYAIAALEAGQCDFVVLIAWAPPIGPRVMQEMIGEQALVLVAAPGFPAPALPISSDELGTLPWISEPSGGVRRRLEEHHLRLLGVDGRQIVAELGHPEAIKRLVRDGLGVTLALECSVADEVAAGTLRPLPIEDHEQRVPVLLLQLRDRSLTPAQALLRDAVRAGLKHGAEPKPLARIA